MSTQYFIFAYREVHYSLPVVSITEIVEVSEWLPFPHNFPGCFGNIVHRNLLLPVFDPTILGTDLIKKPVNSANLMVIIINYEGTAFGLAIDQQITIASLSAFDEIKDEVKDEVKKDKVKSEDSSVDQSIDQPIDIDQVALAQAQNKPFVEDTRAYRGNTLISLDIAAIANAVKRLCSNQHFTPEENSALQDEGNPVAIEATEATGNRFMCARIEDITLSIPIEQVMEVIEDHDVTPAFKVNPSLRGFINLRGQVIACFDVSRELGFPLRKLDERNQFIVLQGDGAELALCVDKILGLRSLPHHQIQSTEAILSGEITRYVHSVFETEQNTILLLSVSDVFESPDLQPYLKS